MKNNTEIIVLLGIIFILFVSLVVFYEDKIDKLQERMDDSKLNTKCICTTSE